MSNELRRWILLCEQFVAEAKQTSATPTSFFHASNADFPLGLVIKGRGPASAFHEREAFLEEHRPTHCLARPLSVFMGATSKEVQMWGPKIYEVDVVTFDVSDRRNCF